MINGDHVLQIGKSKAKTSSRLHSLLAGARPGIHNKSFLVGLAPEAFGNKNQIYYSESKDATKDEVEIHRLL